MILGTSNLNQTSKSTKDSIAAYLVQRGFNRVFISHNPNALTIVKMDEEGGKPQTICLADADLGKRQVEKLFDSIDLINDQLLDSSVVDTSEASGMLNLVVGSHNNEALEYCKTRENCWYLDKIDQKIYLYDNQVSDFHNIRAGLENWIAAKGVIFPREISNNYVRPISVPAIAISIVCVIMFILLNAGIVQLSVCGLDAESLFTKGEWYRLFTYQLSHQQISHLMMNLLMLIAISGYTEHYYGRVQYLIGYFLSGAFAGVCSMAYSVYSNNPYISLGASGAIYGLVGMTLFHLMINWKQFNSDFWRRLIFAVLLIVMGSVYSSGVDHFAHIGGFLSGYFIGAIMTGIQCVLNYHREKNE